MLYAPDTETIDMPTLHAELNMPYTLTPGKAAGTFLAEIGNKRIVGSRFKSGLTIAPAQDFSHIDGEDDYEFVEAPATGVVTAFTTVDGLTIALIQLDGCDNEFPHRLLGEAQIGDRVAAVWGDDGEDQGSILTIQGFRPAPDAAVGEVKPYGETAAPVEVVKYALSLQYEHAYGPYYGRMFDEIREYGRVMGVRTPTGDTALLPPREIDDITHQRTGTWKTCGNEGTIRGCSIINMEFRGQTRPPPYIYAEIVLDGASTRLIHMIEIDSLEEGKKIGPGTRVRAVWREGQRTGSLTNDIERFEVIEK
jgi:uncharacterized OB-fold protein